MVSLIRIAGIGGRFMHDRQEVPMKPRSGAGMHPTAIRATAFAMVLIGAGVAAGTARADPISPDYDGSYSGMVAAVDPLSGGACREGSNVTVRVEDGSLHAAGVASAETMRAIVTEDGFFTGETSIGRGDSRRIEGLIDGNTLVGGLFGEGCAWLVKLNKSGEQQQRISQAE